MLVTGLPFRSPRSPRVSPPCSVPPIMLVREGPYRRRMNLRDVWPDAVAAASPPACAPGGPTRGPRPTRQPRTDLRSCGRHSAASPRTVERPDAHEPRPKARLADRSATRLDGVAADGARSVAAISAGSCALSTFLREDAGPKQNRDPAGWTVNAARLAVAARGSSSPCCARARAVRPMQARTGTLVLLAGVRARSSPIDS